jgi:catechol 2,3-dioxygenase-like lactoylglutathione lyase family enzyme
VTAVGGIRSIVLECSDPERVATFWSAVLGQEIAARQDDWWALARTDARPRLAFQVTAGYTAPDWPGSTGEQQVHLDVEVEDLDVARERVLGLGAIQLSDVVQDQAEDAPWQVFADPAGHPFCLVTSP